MISNAPQLQPADMAAVPMIVAATAPPAVSTRAGPAASDTASARVNPMATGGPLPRRPSTRMLATVDALLPLSLLEAVRNVDPPSDQLDAEYVDELRNKRL